MRTTIAAALTCAVLSAATASSAHAFCGFYVSGAGADMFNNATQVVMMREGKRTVLSMQNGYQGPPEDFAMVVPVPVVLQEENVKTLDDAIFDRVDALAAPRLVEYWEEDPCQPRVKYDMAARAVMESGAMADEEDGAGGGLGVTIEAQFEVGEYEIVILSAKDSTGLDTWLRQEKYQIPAGAEPLLKPYVQGGMKFFVAKVNADKVNFKDGQAVLSPLRFHYDSDEFSLPVRLGMINSAGTQDLIVHILARGQRYEVANYKNVTIPTNLDVKDAARDRFGEFYAALFDRTLAKTPKSVVTEYSWDASSCDPCPTPALTPSELATLGYDVLYTPMPKPKAARDAVDELLADDGAVAPPAPPQQWPGGFVLTRLHARYSKDGLADDLVFKAAPPIAGGREFRAQGDKLEQGASSSSINNFQARYAIRHPWTGPIECENPRRGIWGGPPPGVNASGQPKPALELAAAPRGQLQLAAMVAQDVPEVDVKAGAAAPAPTSPSSSQTPEPPTKQGKGCDIGGGVGARGGAGGLLLLLLAVAALAIGRRWRRS
ncbi:MAG: DUF2330 domain-containing protein [Haliangiales bacterium]